MGFQEEVCPEPICLQPLAWLQAKEGTHSAAPMRLLRSEGQGWKKVPTDNLALVLGPLSLPWRDLSNAFCVWGQWGQWGQWAVARGPGVWRGLLGKASPTHRTPTCLQFKSRLLQGGP